MAMQGEFNLDASHMRSPCVFFQHEYSSLPETSTLIQLGSLSLWSPYGDRVRQAKFQTCSQYDSVSYEYYLPGGISPNFVADFSI